MWAIAEGGCLAGWSRYALLGVDIITALLIVSTLVTLPVMLAAGYVAWRNWRQLRADAKDADESADNYSLYMSRGGAILSVLFLALVVLETVPALVLQPCLWIGPMG
jgi:hypothetical protein